MAVAVAVAKKTSEWKNVTTNTPTCSPRQIEEQTQFLAEGQHHLPCIPKHRINKNVAIAFERYRKSQDSCNERPHQSTLRMHSIMFAWVAHEKPPQSLVAQMSSLQIRTRGQSRTQCAQQTGEGNIRQIRRLPE